MGLTLQQFAPTGLPPALQNNAARALAFGRELLATVEGLRFTSGYRTAAHNRAVGGVADSKHVQALALDFVSTNGRYPQALVDRVRQVATAHGFNVLLHDAGSGLHLHCEYDWSNDERAATGTQNGFDANGFRWWPWAFAGLAAFFVIVMLDD